ncbi:MAG: DUF2568 domain-containing protein [Tissierellia bacterium]|nr:DUF2568 domain-containing protein [Tissierellia bacterium]
MLKINDLFALILEMLSLIILVTWAYAIPNVMWKKLILALIVLLIFSGFWGAFFSPKAIYPINGVKNWFLKFIILFIPYLRFVNSKRHFVFLGGLLIIVNLFIQGYFGREDW